MARSARVIIPDCPHHVTQRGNRRMQTFFSDEDYRRYLAILVDWCGRYGVRIWSYCLMPNHVHLILVPGDEHGLARAVGELHRRYSLRVNERQDWRGHLWQGRFGSFAMDEPHLLAAARYIERNPVKAGLADRAERWPWSSAAAHAAGRRDSVAEVQWLRERTTAWPCPWSDYLAQTPDDAFVSAMRACERTGRPMGERTWLEHLENLLGRPVLPRKGGRPKKQSVDPTTQEA